MSARFSVSTGLGNFLGGGSGDLAAHGRQTAHRQRFGESSAGFIGDTRARRDPREGFGCPRGVTCCQACLPQDDQSRDVAEGYGGLGGLHCGVHQASS